MAVVPIVKKIFNSGEFSPKIYGRTELERYEGGSKTLQDFIPIPQGGIVRRPGSQFISVANTNNNIRLIPFQFSTTQAYILEFGNGYMRVFKDGGIVLDGNNNAYTLNTPFNEACIPGLAWAQSFDTLYVVNNYLAPREITRTAHNAWNINAVSFNNQPSSWDNNNGWPRCITFYQDRLVFASSVHRPSTIWFSKVGNYSNMTTGTNDSDGFQITLLSGQADVLHWLSSHKSLLVGADSGVWNVKAPQGATIPISPTNRKADKDDYFGSSNALPARLGAHVVYPQYLSGKVRDLAYSYEGEGYISSEISVLADHLFEGYQITELAYQQSPFEIVWIRRSDGKLLALTYLAEHRVIGWSQHNLGNVASLACIPGNLETELWIATRRNNNLLIERLSQFYFSGMNNAFFVDSGISGAANSNSVSGFNHLIGEVVQYLADGVSGSSTVSNAGVVTLPGTANNVVIGLGYNSVWESLPLEAEIKSGPTMFKTKRITEISVRVRNSAGGTYGPNNNYQTSLLNSNALFSGDKAHLSIRGGHNTHRTVMIKQTDPYPLAIDAVGFEVEVE